MTGSVGKRHIAKGWSKAGISELVQGKTTLSPEDPFENIVAFPRGGGVLKSLLISLKEKPDLF